MKGKMEMSEKLAQSIASIRNADLPLSMVCLMPDSYQRKYVSGLNLARVEWKLRQQETIPKNAQVYRAKLGDTFVITEEDGHKPLDVQTFLNTLECYQVEKNIYFAGGIYPQRYAQDASVYHFDAVRPNQGHIPYMTLHNNGLSLCMHHAALYRLDGDTAIYCNGTGCRIESSYRPKKVQLWQDLLEDLLKAINEKYFCE